MDKLSEEIVRILKSELTDLEGVYLFGSQATGNIKKGSDWDFGYLSRTGLENNRRWNIISDLGAQYDADIDLVDLYKANTILQIEVLKNGKILWMSDRNKVATFEYLTLSFYQKLNDERADILTSVKRRGSIYG